MEHLGEFLRLKMSELRINAYDIAEDMGRTPQSIYKLFKRKSLDNDIIEEFSIKLEYNLFEHLYKRVENAIKKQPEHHNLINQASISSTEMEYLKDKIRLQEVLIESLQERIGELKKRLEN